jgi:hypothetical protein
VTVPSILQHSYLKALYAQVQPFLMTFKAIPELLGGVQADYT